MAGLYYRGDVPRTPWITPRQFVTQIHLIVAIGVGIAAAMYLHLGWWSLAPAIGIELVLELALLSRATAWLSIAIGTAAVAGAVAIGGIALAAAFTNVRLVWWVGAVVGGVVGALLMIDSHRRLRREREAR